MIKLVSGVFLIANLISPVWAGERFVLYDNFNSYKINPDKWFGRTSGFGQQVTDEVRIALLGSLHLVSRAYAIPSPNIGGESFYGQGLGFIDPDAITSVKTSIRVLAYDLKGCGDLDVNSRVRARFAGYFFNTTGSPTPGNPEGDVFVTFALQRNAGSLDPLNTLRVGAGLSLCLDASCLAFQVLNGVDLGTARIGQRVALRLEWDKENHRFIVQRDNQPEVFLPYDVPDSSPPGLKSKRLEVARSISNCSAEPRPTSYMSAFFGDVYVNSSAVVTQ